MANGWTPERRARQAEAIQQWQPWAKSTGPRTKAGRAAARGNAWKGGQRPMLRSLSRALQGQREWLVEL